MAHPYTAQANLENKIGVNQLAALLDRNHDGTADPNVLADAIETACAEIDSRLRGMYQVPFQAVSDNPACDRNITDAATYRALALLFDGDLPDGPESKKWTSYFESHIDKILSGIFQLDATLAPKQSAEKKNVGMSFTAGDRFLAGTNDDGSSKVNSW